MRKAIECSQLQIRQRNVGIITSGREHRKGLDVNVRNVHLAGKRMSTNHMSKRVNNKVSILTGFFSLT